MNILRQVYRSDPAYLMYAGLIGIDTVLSSISLLACYKSNVSLRADALLNFLTRAQPASPEQRSGVKEAMVCYGLHNSLGLDSNSLGKSISI